MLLHHPAREGREIECWAEIALHEIGFRPGQFRQLPDLDLAVLGQRAHRNDGGLEAPEQCDDDLLDRAKLKDGAISRLKADFEQGGGQRF